MYYGFPSTVRPRSPSLCLSPSSGPPHNNNNNTNNNNNNDTNNNVIIIITIRPGPPPFLPLAPLRERDYVYAYIYIYIHTHIYTHVYTLYQICPRRRLKLFLCSLPPPFPLIAVVVRGQISSLWAGGIRQKTRPDSPPEVDKVSASAGWKSSTTDSTKR